MVIKTAFFDIDGTLVSFKTHQVPAPTIKAIEQAKEQDVKIFISTGRPIAIISNIDVIRHLIDGHITFNGARSLVGEEDVTLMPTPRTEVRTMTEDASRRDHAVLVCGRDAVVLHNHKPTSDEILVQDLDVNNIDINKPAESLLSQPVLQLTSFFSEGDEKAIPSSTPYCVSARWHPNSTDITVQEANEEDALKQVSKRLDISLEECIAFGDGGNDTAILQTAGIGVVMGNVYEGVQAVVDYVTTSVGEDGIRNASIHFGIINN